MICVRINSIWRRMRIRRDLLSELYDNNAGIADVGRSPGASLQRTQDFAPQRTGNFAARNP